jgi:hypothetical protein
MVYMSGSKASRHAASITNRPTCGGPKKGGLMGGIGSIGTGGMSSRQARRFCGTNSACGSYDMNTVFNVVCRGNYTNGSQVAAKMAQRGMF